MFHHKSISRGYILYCLLIAITCFLPGRMEAVYVQAYPIVDSTNNMLILKKDGVVKKTIYIGQKVAIKPVNGSTTTGTLTAIHQDYLIVDQKKIPIATIEWIKDKSRKDTAAIISKWIGIAAGGALLGVLYFMIIFSLAYAAAGGGAILIGIIIMGGLGWLYAKLISRKKYKLKKYQLKIKKRK